MHDLPLLTTVAAALPAALILGLLAKWIGLSPIVGYLLAGVVIGPYTPGFVGDQEIAHQLSELGVILMMFGVGLHFHLKDLLRVKGVAVPGAIVQSATATVLAMVAFHFFGWQWQSGLVLGMALAVASTVVLLRVLMDRDMLTTVHGHVAVGWLIVEDIFTVLALVVVPMLGVGMSLAGGEAGSVAAVGEGHGAGGSIGLASIGWAVAKLVGLVALVFLAGSRVVPWVLTRVAKLRSRELFTLTVLVVSVAIAVGAAALFDASVALGAFLAGMVVAQSPVSHQAAGDVLPLRDAFAVLFFVSVGMLFDPAFLVREPWMVAAAVGIVIIAKPIAALVIVAILGHPPRTALAVAIGLGQIGEFSFILATVAIQHGVLPEDGRHVLVATAMVSITLNTVAFRTLDPIERWLQRMPRVWRVMTARSERRARSLNAGAQGAIAGTTKPIAVIVGYGPVGRVVDAVLRDAGMHTVIIDMNLETVESIIARGHSAIYGDATRPEILESAGVRRAVHLIVTLPHSTNRTEMVMVAREMNPKVEITVRARYLAEHDTLMASGVNKVVYEEGEAGIALARHVMVRRGMAGPAIDKMLDALRRIWKIRD
jgi:CPA2 family monovalent cation:H+ antiporter-2